MKVTISFGIIGGEYKSFPDMDDDHLWANLKIGDTVDIMHSSKNWEGTYEVFNKTTGKDSINYSLILMKVLLWNTQPGHYKRWIGEVKDTDVVCSWGKIGQALQSVTKEFRTKREASDFLREKMDEKLKKGYKLKNEA